MSDTELLEVPADVDDDGFIDEEEIIEVAAQESQHISDQYRAWFPDDYFIGIIGHRGSGKDILLAKYALTSLKNGFKVFTNATLHPEVYGIKNTAEPITLPFLLTFPPSLVNAVVCISEIGTWFKSQRAMSTSSLIAEDFWAQIRKRGLRIIFSNQRPKLPGGLWEQIDLLTLAHDMFFSEWGRESGLPKGVCYSYDHYDLSGIFTGYEGNHWTTWLYGADRIWPGYETNQIFEPLQWAKKVRVDSEEIVVDPTTGEYYRSEEKDLRNQQKIIEQYQPILRKYWRNWESGLLPLARQADAVMEDLPDRIVLSVSKLQRMLVSLKGKKRKDVEDDYNELRQLASSGQLARFGSAQKKIELAKPMTEAK